MSLNISKPYSLLMWKHWQNTSDDDWLQLENMYSLLSVCDSFKRLLSAFPSLCHSFSKTIVICVFILFLKPTNISQTHWKLFSFHLAEWSWWYEWHYTGEYRCTINFLKEAFKSFSSKSNPSNPSWYLKLKTLW